MVPYGLPQEKFAAAYRKRLEHTADTSIAALKRFLALPVSPDVVEVTVEIFLDDYGGAPAAWIYHRGKHNRVDSSDPSMFPGNVTQLDLGLSRLNDFDERYFSPAAAFPALQVIAPLLLSWLAECWWKAGGWEYRPSTVLAVHDSFGTEPVILAKGGT